MTRPSRPSTRRLGLLIAALLVTAGCTSTSGKPAATSGVRGSTSTTTPKRGSNAATHDAGVFAAGTYAVGTVQETYVDRTRKTKKNRTAAEKPERTLPTLIFYPAQGTTGFTKSLAGAKPKPGPWPLVVFSHGVTGNGPVYSITLRVLASAGYVVVAPDYPLSKGNAEGGPVITDVAEQTRDIAFLINRVLAASKASSGPLHGEIDPGHIGIAGHSLGAITSLGAGYNACCTDARIKAVAEWAGVFFPLESKGKVAASSRGRPLLIVHGTADRTVNYRFGQAVYKLLGPPKYFITLPGAGHVPPYLFGEANAQSKVTILASIDFFDRYLKDDRSGIDRLHEVVAAAGPAAATEREQPG